MRVTVRDPIRKVDEELMNCFCDMVDRRNALSLISSRDHCQGSSPSRTSDTSQAGFEPVQNLSSGFVESICTVVITTTPWHQTSKRQKPMHLINKRKKNR